MLAHNQQQQIELHHEHRCLPARRRSTALQLRIAFDLSSILISLSRNSLFSLILADRLCLNRAAGGVSVNGILYPFSIASKMKAGGQSSFFQKSLNCLSCMCPGTPSFVISCLLRACCTSGNAYSLGIIAGNGSERNDRKHASKKPNLYIFEHTTTGLTHEH